MKKLVSLFLFISMTAFLVGCTSTTVTCGPGTTIEDGVCVPIELEETIDPRITCETDLSVYTDDSENYELTWSDEFDYEGKLDNTKWKYQTGNGSTYGNTGWGNNEEQFYTNTLENVNVKNGLLTITASTKENSQYNYTSGRVRTMDKGDFKYGIFEICALIPEGLGTWPAIWMLPTDSPYGGWPQSGEIDIMEAVGFETQGIIHGSIHTNNHNWNNGGKSLGDKITNTTLHDKFHRYSVKWTEDSITFYLDGSSYYTWSPSNINDPNEWPFDTEFHILLNIAVGGTWGGQKGIQIGEWQSSMLVDYVRVYQEN